MQDSFDDDWTLGFVVEAFLLVPQKVAKWGLGSETPSDSQWVKSSVGIHVGIMVGDREANTTVYMTYEATGATLTARLVSPITCPPVPCAEPPWCMM